MLSQLTRCIALVALLSVDVVLGHTIITYPGYRGNNLYTNGTVEQSNGLGAAWQDGSYIYPFGMEWMYPCGGMPMSTNRTKWPVGGGAIAIQPAWFPGHETGFIYMNMGHGTIPPNMSNPMIKPFQIGGPTNLPYPGTFCLPQVPLPQGWTVNVGDNATIQVVLAAKHGAALYNCVDITFADPKDVEEVTRENCFNSSDISFDQIFAASSLQSGAVRAGVSRVLPVVVMTVMVLFWM